MADYKIIKTDALVIGGGISALMAAKELSKVPGVQVKILSDGAGASPYVHGLNMPLHQDDSVELFIEDTMKSGRLQSKKELVDTLCRNSLELLPLLSELGIIFDKKDNGEYSLLRPLGSSVPRVASAGNHTGVYIINALKKELKENPDVEFLPGTRALRLMADGGQIKGALVYSEERRRFSVMLAKTVVLACGGFCRIYPFSTNSSDIGGDGVAMAYEAGCSLVDLEYVQFEPSAAVTPSEIREKSVITTMFYEGAVLKNSLGERFMLNYGSDGECVNKDVLSRAIYREIKEGRGTPAGGVYFDATGVGREKLNSLYGAYVRRYADVGIDIAETPFEIAPAPHTSLGGVAIEADCSCALEGLFVCGEAAGGIHGANRIGGNAGLEILVFGRIAGQSASRYLKECIWDAPNKAGCDDFADSVFEGGTATLSSSHRLSEIRERMGLILSEKLNVLRCGEELAKARGELSDLLEEVSSFSLKGVEPELINKTLRLQNDLVCALLLTISSQLRTESSGCHVRTDSLETGERYRISITKSERGAVVVKQNI